MRISDWSSDVCSSDLLSDAPKPENAHAPAMYAPDERIVFPRPPAIPDEAVAGDHMPGHGKEQAERHVRDAAVRDVRRVRHHDAATAGRLDIDPLVAGDRARNQPQPRQRLHKFGADRGGPAQRLDAATTRRGRGGRGDGPTREK